MFHEIANRWACDKYKKRSTGKKHWDHCPDCEYVATTPPYCWSKAQHIGGKETDYCQQKGAKKGISNAGCCEPGVILPG
ncbi:hypothetical protein HYALB_00012171 [Hymenoscyphus albidus]|uniref:Uncharacterized protein n=1 Tax=Hymenoscyphus albidus TaxID=595503 RepID=A0A9N9LUG6_9HELO|nr:hypothetical protein HYALB_00012171 [Hymenoscyphus albidus]